MNTGACKHSHQRNILGLINLTVTLYVTYFSTGVASRTWTVTCTSNRLTQAHWHRPWTALFRWSGLVVCKSTRENSDTVFLVLGVLQEALGAVGSKSSLFIFIVPKCSQLNKIDRKKKISFLPLILFNCTQYLFCCFVEKSSCILDSESGVYLLVNCEFCLV